MAPAVGGLFGFGPPLTNWPGNDWTWPGLSSKLLNVDLNASAPSSVPCQTSGPAPGNGTLLRSHVSKKIGCTVTCTPVCAGSEVNCTVADSLPNAPSTFLLKRVTTRFVFQPDGTVAP